MSSERKKRALARKNWPGGLVSRQTEAQLPTGIERLESMWQLALDSWSLQGKELPKYERSAIPGKLTLPE